MLASCYVLCFRQRHDIYCLSSLTSRPSQELQPLMRAHHTTIKSNSSLLVGLLQLKSRIQLTSARVLEAANFATWATGCVERLLSISITVDAATAFEPQLVVSTKSFSFVDKDLSYSLRRARFYAASRSFRGRLAAPLQPPPTSGSCMPLVGHRTPYRYLECPTGRSPCNAG